MRKISRATAIKRGLPRYFTGEACKRGHVAERTTAQGACRECLRLASAKHNETPKRKVSNARYWNSPKGRQNTHRANTSPKGRQRFARYELSAKAGERVRRYWGTDKAAKRRRAYQNTPGYCEKKNERNREIYLDRLLDPDHEMFNPGRADILIAKRAKT